MKAVIISSVFLLVLLSGCTDAGEPESQENASLEVATFAGGCFWCMEAVFQEMDGVSEVYSGYTGGHKENPAYSEVASGTTGHLEAVEVYYDPSVVTYEELLEAFWTNIDPTDGGGQFVDRGPQYGTAVFYHDETQRELAEQSKIKLWESGRLDAPVVTEIRPAEVFYIAEEYHQDYYIKRTFQYRIYESGSGREERLGELWEE